MIDNKFHKTAGPFSLVELAKLVNARLIHKEIDFDFNHKNNDVCGASDIDNAEKGFITFININKTLYKLKNSNALACLVKKYEPDYFPKNMICLEVDNPHLAFATISQKFYPDFITKPKISGNCEISKQSIISSSARVESFTVIEEGVVIGENVCIGSGCYIGRGVKIGNNTRILSNASIECAEIGANVLIYHGVRIGQRGFGFAISKDGHVKLPQVGKVLIHDNVEIGANSCIDRGSYGSTIIGEGTFIDNLVHIAHNVKVGKHCAIAGQVGIAGSAIIEDYCVFGGQAGVGGHIRIGTGVQAGGQSGITKSLEDGEKVSGTPAMSLNDYHRKSILIKKLIKNKGKS